MINDLAVWGVYCGVTVLVGVKVKLPEGVRVWDGVKEGVKVKLGVGVSVLDGVKVRLGVGVGVLDGETVGVVVGNRVELELFGLPHKGLPLASIPFL